MDSDTSDIPADEPSAADIALDQLAVLRQRVLGLGDTVLEHLERDLRSGSMAQRNTAIKLVAPFLLRSLEAQDDDAALEQMRLEFEKMMTKVMGMDDSPTAITGHEPGETTTPTTPTTLTSAPDFPTAEVDPGPAA